METRICASQKCPDWSEWSDWSECSVSCGDGQQSRDRRCVNGMTDKDCEGAPKELRNCSMKNCEIFWTEWGAWSQCSVSCGGGITIRSRTCGEDDHGDDDHEDGCMGDETETLPCKSEACPKWSEWSLWSDCDVTCGDGNRARSRICEHGGTAGIDCIGSAVDFEACFQKCTVSWNEWGEWSLCDVTCGGGEMLRFRTCNGGTAGVECEGDPVENQVCNILKCPTWTEYGDWSECSASCGAGERIRVRDCNGGIAGVDCEGESLDGEDCTIKECASWTEYGDWSECSASCGAGERIRLRDCSGGIAGVDCEGESLEGEDCTIKKCAFWTQYGDWSECSASCGEGEQIRIRMCTNGEGGVDCVGDDMQTQICNIRECITWTQWGEWSDCSSTCGDGEAIRVRTCTDGIAGVDCVGDAMETKNCNERKCIFAVISWANWMQWSDCDATCGFAERVRLRSCEGGKPGLDCAGEDVDSEQCALLACPFWDEWTTWSECSATCGNGDRSRERECLNGDVGVDCFGSDFETESCNNGECSRWGEYTPWSVCSVTCGTGVVMRTRLCVRGSTGDDCIGDPQEIQSCEKEMCETGEWGPWQQWSICSATCGGGERNRFRVCVGGMAGSGGCPGPDSEIGICGESEFDDCPKWSSWSTWSECNSTCGGGQKRHTRICINGDVGEGCGDGPTSEEMDCNSQQCPIWGVWTSWSGCSKSCDGGLRERSRECINGFPGDIGCDETDGVGEFANQICNPQVCPRFGPWSAWSACNGTCGEPGIRIHTRECVGGEVGQLGCEGPVSEDQDCEGSPCPFWSPWDGWGSCTKPCGAGVRSRGRLCVHGNPGESGCQGPDSQTEVCNQETCSYWSKWGEWGACSRTCGEAERFRIRLCINGEIGEAGCDIGSSTEVADCPFIDCNACTPNLELQGISNGFVACTLSTQIGSICTFSCEDNYQLVGIDSSTCEEKSQNVAEWSVGPPTCTERCSDETDIVFVIDSSSSIKEQNFKVIRSFIKQVVRRFRIGQNAALVGALRYNKEVSKLWDLNSYRTLDEVLNAIDNIPYDGSGTMTGQAIQYAHDHMFKAEAGRRPGVPKVVVVITDGVSFDDVSQSSTLLKSEGALIVAVGIGNVNIDEINDIASDPDRHFATTVSDFDSLPKVVSTIADQVKLCQPIEIPLNCPPQALIDLVFIVDSSSSIGLQNFETIRKFIKDIIIEFNVGYDSAMFGLIMFNRDVNEVFQLQDYDEKSEVIEAIDGLPYSGSGTRTGKALMYAAANSFLESAGGRPGIPKVSIVITDGKSQDDVQSGAVQLKQKANVIVIGIEGAVKTELNQIASYSSNVFTTRFETLGEVMDQLKMAVCFASRAGMMVVEE
ncbi:A disintegrin and metalloproteinase with thrombospondin motifs gon-1-like isoform X1 [Styela clava]